VSGSSGPVISNASPLILLSAIGRLDLLRELFGQVIVAPEVFNEVTVKGEGRPGAREVVEADFIRTQELSDPSAAARIAQEQGIGAGEAATLALAREMVAVVVLIDDKRGRTAARALGLAVAGTVGVLERGHERGLLPDLRSDYLRLQVVAGWIAPMVLNASLRRLGLPPLGEG